MLTTPHQLERDFLKFCRVNKIKIKRNAYFYILHNGTSRIQFDADFPNYVKYWQTDLFANVNFNFNINSLDELVKKLIVNNVLSRYQNYKIPKIQRTRKIYSKCVSTITASPERKIENFLRERTSPYQWERLSNPYEQDILSLSQKLYFSQKTRTKCPNCYEYITVDREQLLLSKAIFHLKNS